MAPETHSMLVQGRKKRIAIIGGGVSGISCMWTLRPHDEYEVHLFEAEDRLGGHANTVPFNGNGKTVSVDTGFIAMNDDTYPEFSSFLRELNVQTISTDMSFSVSMNQGVFEWGSCSIKSFVGNWSNLLKPWFWRLCFDIFRFNFVAPDILAEPEPDQSDSDSDEFLDEGVELPSKRMGSIGAYLRRHKYSEQFAKLFLIPMVAAPWCIDPEEFSSNFPARHLIGFMADHRLLDTMWHTLRWRTFPHGSQAYVNAFLDNLRPGYYVHTNAVCTGIERHGNGKADVYTTQSGKPMFGTTFDHVVLAVHANQALKILGDEATFSERQILGCFKTSENICVLHSDTSLLPVRPDARASWNCLLEDFTAAPHLLNGKVQPEKHHQKISVTFDMNRLHGIAPAGTPESPGHVLVSMNPPRDPSSAQRADIYYHPLFTSDSVQAAELLPHINGVDGVSFAGAWMGYGFHEDGFVAGMRVAQKILKNDRADSDDPAPEPTAMPQGAPKTGLGVRCIKRLIQAVQYLVA